MPDVEDPFLAHRRARAGVDDEKRDLPRRLGGHERKDPAGLAGPPQSDAVGANVVTCRHEPYAGEHVGREHGEVGLLPVPGRVTGAALVVAQDREAETGEVPGPRAEYVAGQRVGTVHQDQRRVRWRPGGTRQGPAQRNRAIGELHLLVSGGDTPGHDRWVITLGEAEPADLRCRPGAQIELSAGKTGEMREWPTRRRSLRVG